MKKKVSELKPGDVLTRNETFGPTVVCRIGLTDVPDRLQVHHFSLMRESLDRSYFAPDDVVAVEVPHLTPAQMHAEELLTWVGRAARGQILGDDQKALAELLDNIKRTVSSSVSQVHYWIDRATRAEEAFVHAKYEAEKNEQDAARYRWLCSNNFDRQGETQVHTWAHRWEPHSQTGEPTEWKQRVRGVALDWVIDQARTKGAQS